MKHKNSFGEGRGKVSFAARGRWLFSFKGMAALIGAFLLLGLGMYVGERIIRANPRLMPVKARIRLFDGARFTLLSDSDVGFREQPHVRTWVTSEDFEFLYETDSYGFHNRMPWPETVDLLFLGDSLLEGVGVGIDHQFSSLVGQAFPNMTVLNLGMGGAGPNRQLRIYRKFGSSLRPVLVISCIYLVADLNGELYFDDWLKSSERTDYDQSRLDLKNQLYPKSLWTRVQRRCYLCGKLTELVLRWNGVPDRFIFPTGSEIFLDIDKLRFLSPRLNPSDQRLTLMMRSLKSIQALAQSQGAKFAVVLIPSKEEIYGAPFMPEVMKPVEALQQHLRGENFPVLSLYDALRDRGQEQAVFFTRDIHLNAYGNRIVSEVLVDWLRENNFLKKTP